MWARFGPYHLARLRGAAEAAGRCARIHGIEICRTDSIYAWDQVESDGTFERVTLFPDRAYETLSAGEIRAAVHEALNRMSPDVVAVNGWGVEEARAAIDWRHGRGGRRVVLMSETKEDDAPRVWWKEVVKSRIVRRCDVALVGGRAQAAYLRRLGFPEARIFIGYDAVDNDYFSRGAEAVRARAGCTRQELGLPERFFFACTRFIPRKNIDGLLEAYASYRAASAGPPWGLVIAGAGEETATLLGLERDLQLEGVIWPGFVQYESLPIYYGLASAFIHPAKTEAWGLVLNEAAASGLPLLASRTVGAGLELLREGENGFGFDPFDGGEIRNAMFRMAQAADPELARMGRRSMAIVQDWGPERFGAQLLAASTLRLFADPGLTPGNVA